jgi:DNA-binding MarR family transcriptional regulator
MQASVSEEQRPAAAAPDSSPDAVAAALGAFLKHVLTTTSRDFFSAVEEAGITFTQMKCLHVIADTGEPLSVGALSETLGLSVPAVSRAVDGLVQRGEVKRTEDPRDRRSKLLTVSPRGRRTYDRLGALRFAGIKRFVEELSESEREALASGIAPIAGRLER